MNYSKTFLQQLNQILVNLKNKFYRRNRKLITRSDNQRELVLTADVIVVASTECLN